MFTLSSHAKWTKVSQGLVKIEYIDFEKIKRRDGYVYFWQLQDYLKPTKYGILSSKIYNQGDCKLIRYKNLSFVVHKQSMGRGWWRTSPRRKPEWRYPSPGTAMDEVLKKVCNEND